MTEESAITIREEKPMSVLDLPPRRMVEQVTVMADVLKDVIDQQKMYQDIGSNKYVTVEGWITLGAMLGILPVEEDVHEIEKGWYAKVKLVNKNTGVVVGGASAICTRDEKTWKTRDEYAVRSMSITRATGKAYRLAFAWIMHMAGYKTTPAEEMPDEKPQEVFDKDNQNHLDRLSKRVEGRVHPEFHLAIADWLHGKPITKTNFESAIKYCVRSE